MVNEQSASLLLILAMGTLSLGIASFSKFASLGASYSCLAISTFSLDGSSTLVGPSDSSNFSFPSLIKSQTSYLNALQFFVEWPGIPAW